MLVCCSKEMKVEKNGIGVETQGGTFPGDRYVCLACHRTVVQVADFGSLTDALRVQSGLPAEGVFDPDHELFSEYVVLK
jgi:hypothetical protein